MPEPLPPVEPSRCPLCGGPNNCAMAGSSTAVDCWCSRVRIPEELLARVPEAARDEACICARCVAAASEPHPPPG